MKKRVIKIQKQGFSLDNHSKILNYESESAVRREYPGSASTGALMARSLSIMGQAFGRDDASGWRRMSLACPYGRLWGGKSSQKKLQFHAVTADLSIYPFDARCCPLIMEVRLSEFYYRWIGAS